LQCAGRFESLISTAGATIAHFHRSAHNGMDGKVSRRITTLARSVRRFVQSASSAILANGTLSALPGNSKIAPCVN
jgi:hypothetical protein